MPYSAPNLPLNTTATSWTAIAENFDDLRSYLNAIPVGDVAALAVEREHVVAPLVRGYPHDRYESEVQIRGGHEYGTRSPLGMFSPSWGARVERLTIIPKYVEPRAYLPIGWTIYVPDAWGLSRNYEIEVGGAVHVRVETHIWQAGTVGADSLVDDIYPDGAALSLVGIGASAGRLELRARDRVTGLWTPNLAGACDLYPQDYVRADGVAGMLFFRGEPWRCTFVGDLVAGRVYDLVLTYVRGDAPIGIHQIDLSEITAKLAIS